MMRSPRGVENEAVEQVTFADRIILNKCDLVTEEAELMAIEKRLHELTPVAEIYRAKHSKVDPKKLINLKVSLYNVSLSLTPSSLTLMVSMSMIPTSAQWLPNSKVWLTRTTCRTGLER